MEALPRVQQDLEVQSSSVSDDLQKLKHHLLIIESTLGAQANKIEGINFPDSWSAIHHLADAKADRAE
eukprot:406968-Ditylum_brightwellii.AAC.1